ncbi:MAG: glycosyltransferase family 2 protein [Candidatus Competibacteraceae bacterium]|nr:glycosyltransferase family 2 protein [Candidatus Competibacteraceae bacterium]
MTLPLKLPALGKYAPGLDLLSIVVPVHNEAAVLTAFHERLMPVVAELSLTVEILYVDDGSSDPSPKILRQLRMRDTRVAVLELSRNFGKEAAMTAGLDHAGGDAVVIIDADLQDPPELIADMVAAWREGYDVVVARRTHRDGETGFKRLSSKLFYRILNRVSAVPIPVDVGDFRLMSRRAVEALKTLPERNRYMKGLFAWVGFPQQELLYAREARHAGCSQWGFWKLLGLALDGLTSFTWAPLRMATIVGVLVAAGALMMGGFILVKTLLYGDPVPGL